MWLLCPSAHRTPLLVPLEVIEVDAGPAPPKITLVCEAGGVISVPLTKGNCLMASWSPDTYTLPFQYAGVPVSSKGKPVMVWITLSYPELYCPRLSRLIR